MASSSQRATQASFQIPRQWILIEEDSRPGRLEMEHVYDTGWLIKYRLQRCARFYEETFASLNVKEAAEQEYMDGCTVQEFMEVLLLEFDKTQQVMDDSLRENKEELYRFCAASNGSLDWVDDLAQAYDDLKECKVEMERLVRDTSRVVRSPGGGASTGDAGKNSEYAAVAFGLEKGLSILAPLIGRVFPLEEDSEGSE